MSGKDTEIISFMQIFYKFCAKIMQNLCFLHFFELFFVQYVHPFRKIL